MLNSLKNPSVKRHFAKTITWRIVGTVDTMILGWIISGDPMIGAKIGGLEVITKMGLYFAHERVWYKFDFGLDKRKKKDDSLQEKEIVNPEIQL
jgi:uncharacterized membrane protein